MLEAGAGRIFRHLICERSEPARCLGVTLRLELPDVEEPDPETDKRTPLHLAVITGALPLIDALIDAGARSLCARTFRFALLIEH